MSGELANATSEFLAALDSMDIDRLMAAFTEDGQGVDELSRRWLRGRSEVDGYLRGMMSAVSDIRTEIRDEEERVWGDTGVLTCWIDQEYTLEGKQQHVSAPTTIVFRREGGTWKAALFHSIPLPEQS